MLSFSEKKDQQRTERDVALKVCVKCHIKRNYGSENAVVRVEKENWKTIQKVKPLSLN